MNGLRYGIVSFLGERKSAAFQLDAGNISSFDRFVDDARKRFATLGTRTVRLLGEQRRYRLKPEAWLNRHVKKPSNRGRSERNSFRDAQACCATRWHDAFCLAKPVRTSVSDIVVQFRSGLRPYCTACCRRQLQSRDLRSRHPEPRLWKMAEQAISRKPAYPTWFHWRQF